MNKKSTYDINFFELIKIFWNKKIIILSLSIILTTLIVFYTNKQTKIYQTNLIIQKPFINLFDIYKVDYGIDQNSSALIAKNYYQNYIGNLSSTTNFYSFFKNYNEQTGEFIKKIDNSNLSPIEYLEDNFRFEVEGNDKLFSIYYTYPEGINGHQILNEYVLYTKNLVTKNFLTGFSINMDAKINDVKNMISILGSNKINNSNEFMLKFNVNQEFDIDILNKDNIKILEERLKQLIVKKNDNIKNNYIKQNYNPILKSATQPKKPVYPDTTKVAILSFLLINIIIIFIFLFIQIRKKII